MLQRDMLELVLLKTGLHQLTRCRGVSREWCTVISALLDDRCIYGADEYLKGRLKRWAHGSLFRHWHLDRRPYSNECPEQWYDERSGSEWSFWLEHDALYVISFGQLTEGFLYETSSAQQRISFEHIIQFKHGVTKHRRYPALRATRSPAMVATTELHVYVLFMDTFSDEFGNEVEVLRGPIHRWRAV